MATSITVKLPNGVEYEQPTGLFINNEFVPSAKGETIKVVNPSTEEELAQVHAADASDIDKAVKAARTAFNTVWKNYSVDEISRLLYKLADLFERDLELLSAIEAADSGKPKAQNAAGDVEEPFNCFATLPAGPTSVPVPFARMIRTHWHTLFMSLMVCVARLSLGTTPLAWLHGRLAPPLLPAMSLF